MRLWTIDAILYDQKARPGYIDDWFDSYNHEQSEFENIAILQFTFL